MAAEHPRAPWEAPRRRSRSPLATLQNWLARRAALRERIDVRRGDAPYDQVVVDLAAPAIPLTPTCPMPTDEPRTSKELL